MNEITNDNLMAEEPVKDNGEVIDNTPDMQYVSEDEPMIGKDIQSKSIIDIRIEQFKLLREQSDFILQLCSKIRTIDKDMLAPNNDPNSKTSFMIQRVMTYSKEIMRGIDYLSLSRNWMGVMLHELGEAYPYSITQSTIEDIRPKVDVVRVSLDEQFTIGLFDNKVYISKKEFEHKNSISKLSFIRELITLLLNDFNRLEIYDYSIKIDNISSNIYTYLQNSKMMFGEELNRIKVTKNYIK